MAEDQARELTRLVPSAAGGERNCATSLLGLSSIALCATPCVLLLVSVYRSSVTLLIPWITLAFIAWFTLFPRDREADPRIRAASVSGFWVGVAGMVLLTALYAAAMLIPPAATWWGLPLRQYTISCVWTSVLSTHIACAAILSLVWREHSTWGFLGLCAATLLLVPLATTDRIPWPVEPKGSPSWLLHATAALTLCYAAVIVWLRPVVRVGLVLRHDDKSSPRTAELATPRACALAYELLPLLAASLSIGYLFCVIGLGRPGRDRDEALVRPAIYHLIWSYLRQAYVALFAVYWLKRIPGPLALPLQAFLCGLGFIFFFFVCPLTLTNGSAWAGSTLDDRFTPEGRHGLNVYSHIVESICFYMSMSLFTIHAMLSPSRSPAAGGQTARTCRLPTPTAYVPAAMLVFFTTFLVFNLIFGHRWPKAEGESEPERARGGMWTRTSRTLIWMLVHYIAGYLIIIMATVHTLADGRGHLLSFTLVERTG